VFEKSLETSADRAANPDESLSPDQVAAHKIAAVILIVNVVITAVASILLSHGKDIPLVQIVVTLIVAQGVYRRAGNWATYAVVVGIAGGVLLPAIAFWQQPLVSGIFVTVVTWGVVGATLLLLLGNPPRARRIAGIVCFLALTCGGYGYLLARVLSH
jgi:hypothetical protein